MTLKLKTGKSDLHGALACAVLLFGTFLVFHRALQNGFLDLDDPDYVTQNAHVKNGVTLAGIKWAFVSGASANWHPVTWISLMLDAQCYGDFAQGYHFTNILLHALNAALAFLALRKLTGAFWPSAFCAALFAWHPLRVESVAWIAERKDVLSGSFFWLTLLAYASFAQRFTSPAGLQTPAKYKTPYIAALLLFALGLMSKPMLVTVPFLLLLLDYWPLQRLNSSTLQRLVTEKIPFLTVSMASCIITFLVQKNWGAVVESQSLGNRLTNAIISVVRYLESFIWPANLAVVYSLPNHWPFFIVAAAVMFVICVSTLAVVQLHRRPWLFVGWFWFMGMLVPVIGFVQVGLQAMADRYTYLPIIGLQLALIWTLAEVRFSRLQLLKPFAVAAALVACIFQTEVQIAFWKNPDSLYEHALVATQRNYLAECYLGTTLLNENRFPEAELHFQQALKLKPDFSDARFKLGVTLAQSGHDNAALAVYGDLLKQNPRHALTDYNIGIILLGQNHPAAAIPHFQNTLARKPDYDAALVALGTAEAKLGNADLAVSYFKQSLELKPDNAVAEYNFANTLNDLHRDDEAVGHYEKALRIDPDFEDARCNYGNALGALGRPAEARDQFRRALVLNPKNSSACFGLAVASEDLGKVSEAAICYRRAIALAPDNVQANYNLATILLNQNHPADALTYFQSTAGLQPENDSAFLGMGLAEEKLGHADAAISHYHRAVKLAPKSAEAHCCLGIALRRTGNFSEAIIEEETALRLNPNFPGLKEQLALARNEMAAAAKE
jgi:tetratricopeptide (TPR) repeat protein